MAGMTMRMGGMSMTDLGGGDQMIVKNGQGMILKANGEQVEIGKGMPCEPGTEFTEYVRSHLKPFPWNQYCPASHKMKNLWPGRRCKLQFGKKSAAVWHQYRVTEWLERSMGPFAAYTLWDVTLEPVFEEGTNIEFAVGHRVKMHGLKQAAHLNDNTGTIFKFLEEKGRFAVKYRQERETKMSAIRPENFVHATTSVVLRVDSADVEHGGMLSGNQSEGMPNQIPFEWIDEPEIPEPEEDEEDKADDGE